MFTAAEVAAIKEELEKEKLERGRLMERLTSTKEDIKKITQDKETV